MTTKNEQLKLPEPGQFTELPNPPPGYAGVLKGITDKRFQLKLVKTAPEKKKA